MITLQEILFALQLSVLGYVITCVLMAQDYLLEWYDDLLIAVENKYKHLKYLTKPLGRCETCFTGQLALWVWIKIKAPIWALYGFEAALKHCVFISFAIIFVILIKAAIKKWK